SSDLACGTWNSDLFSYRPDVPIYVVDDVLHRTSGQENALDTHGLELRDVDVGDDPAHQHQDIVQALFLQELHQARAHVHVRPAQDRQPDDVGVLLKRGGGNLLGRLAQAGVDDLHTRITQRPRNDLGAPIVPIEPGLRDNDSYFSHAQNS